MPQWLYVLRGCVFTYLIASLGFGVIALFDGPVQGAEVFGIALIFGGIIALPFAIAALIIWSVLAGMRKRVSVLQAVAISAGVFFLPGVFLALAEGGLYAVLSAVILMPVLGAAFGALFWVGAFGLQREVQFAFREPAP